VGRDSVNVVDLKGGDSMDRTHELETAIIRVLTEFRDYVNGGNGTQVQLIADRETKHYQLVMIGWENKKRHFGVLTHFSIQNGKAYLEYNGTEEDFAVELEKLGVQKSEIFVAFHSPYMRQFTDYALE
jgi:XisI protein